MCLRTLIGRSIEQQQLDWEMWGCLLDMGRFWRKTGGSCLAILQGLIFSGQLQGLLHRHLYCWTLGVMINMISQQFKRKCSLLKSSFCLSFYISRCLRTVTGRSSEQQQLDWEMRGCLLDTKRFWRKTRGSCLARLHCLMYLSPSGTVASPLVLLGTGGDNQDDLPTVQEKVLTPKIVICLSFHIFFCLQFFLWFWVYLLSLVRRDCISYSCSFNIAFRGKYVSMYVVWANVAGLGTT